MLYRYPPNTIAVVVCNYDAPYPDPIAVRGGDVVVPDEVRTRETDFMGWTWCRGPDGREGWVPDAWLERGPADVRLKRDFDARELSVRTGERVAIELSESGFVFARTATGAAGWIPDAVLALVEPGISH